jgi:two-component system, chemotaxis family, response regulator Rcp1
MNDRFAKSIWTGQAAGQEKKKQGKTRKPDKSRRTKASRNAPLVLGNRFTERGIDLTTSDPLVAEQNRGEPVPPRTDSPEVSPDIWKLFDRDSFQNRFYRPGVKEPATEAKLTPPEPPASKPHTATQLIEILLVEDNPGHVRLMEEALKDSSVQFNMNVVTDGVQAMDFLRRQGKYASVRRPDLILLDLNLPKKNGREVLAEVKLDKDLGSIPVVVLTASTDEEDVRMSYSLQANCYISKPVNLGEFANVVKMIENFWGSYVRLP